MRTLLIKTFILMQLVKHLSRHRGQGGQNPFPATSLPPARTHPPLSPPEIQLTLFPASTGRSRGEAASTPHSLPNSTIWNLQYVKNNALNRSPRKDRYSVLGWDLEMKHWLQDSLSERLWRKSARRTHFHLNFLKPPLLVLFSLYSKLRLRTDTELYLSTSPSAPSPELLNELSLPRLGSQKRTTYPNLPSKLLG